MSFSSIFAQTDKIQEQKDYVFAEGLFKDGNYQIARMQEKT